jgi:hypothetical protein
MSRVPDIQQPADLSSWMREIEQRLRAVESAPKMQNSSVTNGSTSVLDATGAVRTRFGLLSDGTYGLEVQNPTGSLVNISNTVFPKSALQSGTQNISNTSWALLPSGPSVTATIGASGLAMVTVCADIGLNVTNQTAYVGFYNATSGYKVSGWLSVSSSSGNALVAGTSGKSILVSGLPAGSQTFAAAGFVSTSNANYSDPTIIVQPF